MTVITFQHDFNVAVSSLLHSGIYHKFDNDIMTSKTYQRYFFDNYWIRENLRPNKPLTIDHAVPSFMMLGLGIIPAAIIFFLEVLLHKFKKSPTSKMLFTHVEERRDVTRNENVQSPRPDNTSDNPHGPNIKSQQFQEMRVRGKVNKKIGITAVPRKENPQFKKRVESKVKVSFHHVADVSKIDHGPPQPLVNASDNSDDPDIKSQPHQETEVGAKGYDQIEITASAKRGKPQ